MAHKQKYYKDIEANGHNWRLEIWQDTDTDLVPVEIGPVLQTLKIVVQGNQADVDTPIVKTSLEMSFIDAPGYDYERKCGYWEEFYTASATEYLVLLRKDGVTEWTGYITPDSFEEDLRYRGSVSIIARDNLGYMQDFMFRFHSENGLVTIFELLNKAVGTVGFKMDIVGAGLFPKYAEEGDNRDLRDVQFNITAFRDKTWWEVLESVFYSLGLTLRYVGKNRFALSCIREQSKCGYDDYDSMPRKEVRFLSYGHRELVPSAKAIMETAEYDILESFVEIYAPEHQYGEEGTLEFVETYDGQEYTMYDMPVHEYAPQGAGIASAYASSSRVLNPYAYKLRNGGIDKNYPAIHTDDVLLALCNTVDITPYEDEQTGDTTYDYEFRQTHPLVFKSNVQKAGKYDIRFTFERPVVLYDDGTIGDFIESEYGVRLFLGALGFNAMWVGSNGDKRYLGSNLRWGTKEPGLVVTIPSGASTYFTEPVEISLPTLEVSSPGELVIEFYGGYFDSTINRDNTGSLGAYIRITKVDIMASEDTSVQIAERTRITTSYNDKNNLLLKREPEYAPNPNLPLAPQMIVNNILMESGNVYVGAVDWTWETGQETMQLPVMIHKQMLCYYSRPMNLLSGELVDADNDARFDALYLWNGKEHTLFSGTLNVLTGRMEGATLREFMRYEDLWAE